MNWSGAVFIPLAEFLFGISLTNRNMAKIPPRNNGLPILSRGIKPRFVTIACQWTSIARVYLAKQQNDEAKRRLLNGYDGRLNPGVHLGPGFNTLRTDPRFLALSHRVGL
jgi:hypothetical protein